MKINYKRKIKTINKHINIDTLYIIQGLLVFTLISLIVIILTKI